MSEENKEILTKTDQQLDEIRQQLEEKLKNLSEKKEPLEIKKAQILAQIKEIEKKLTPLLKEEEEIEKEKEKKEEEEKVAVSLEKKKEIEKLRWEIEEKRHRIEVKRWRIEKEIEILKEEMAKVDFEYQKIIKEEEKLKREIEKIQAVKKKRELEKKWQEIEKEISLLGEKVESVSKKEREIEENLKKILNQEEEIEKRIEDLEKEEEVAVLPAEKRKIEMERWEIEKERREIEEKKWRQQKEKEEIKSQLKKERINYQKLLDEQENLDKEIEKIKIFLESLGVKEPQKEELTEVKEEVPKVKEGVEEIKEELPEELPKIEKETLEVKEEVPEIKKEVPEIKKEELEVKKKLSEEKSPKVPEEIKEKRLEFLERWEIKTMQKDIARLKEIGAEKKIERIVPLKVGEENPSPVLPFSIPPRPKEEIAPLIPNPPSLRPSLFKKILVRGIILIFCLFLFGFSYWFWTVKKPVVKEGVPPVKEEIVPPKEEIVEKPEITIPPSLISVEETKTFEISKKKEIPQIFSQIMAEGLPEGKFTRIVIKDMSENRLVSLEDLSVSFQIEVPDEIFQKLSPDYTLAIFTQKEGKRVAFITMINEKEGLTDLLKNWEAKIKTEGIYISGQKISALVPYFRTTYYKNISFRYLTISKEDLGICYLYFDDYFVVTTSYRSMKKIIEEL